MRKAINQSRAVQLEASLYYDLTSQGPAAALRPLPQDMDALRSAYEAAIDARVRKDPASVQALLVLARRLNNPSKQGVDLERLQALVFELIKPFCAPGPIPVKQRYAQLRSTIAANAEVSQELGSLRAAGYRLPTADVARTYTLKTVQGNPQLLQRSLRQVFEEYADLLKVAKIKTLSVGGRRLQSSELFSFLLGLPALEQQRTAAAQKLKAAGYMAEILRLEAREAEVRQAAVGRLPQGPIDFTVKLAWELLTSASICPMHIAGCYAPNGIHSEKPLENGLSATNKLIGLLDGKGRVVENIEVSLTREGMYLFALHSDGNSMDTRPLWGHFFHDLLADGTVPSIILPNNAPGYADVAARLSELPARKRAAKSSERGEPIVLDVLFKETYRDERPQISSETLRISAPQRHLLLSGSTAVSAPVQGPSKLEPSPAEGALSSLRRQMGDMPQLRHLQRQMRAYIEARLAAPDAAGKALDVAAAQMTAAIASANHIAGTSVQELTQRWFSLAESVLKEQTPGA